MKFRYLLLVFLLAAAVRLIPTDGDAEPTPIAIAASSSGKSSTERSNGDHSKQENASPRARAVDDALVPPVHLTAPDAGAAGALPAVEIATASPPTPEFSGPSRAIFEPHGQQICASGCAASRHPTAKLTIPAFQLLLEQFAVQPIDETSLALETLLFYGRQTRNLLASKGHSRLDPLRAAVLERELQYTHATIAIRVVDTNGSARSWLPPTRVPLDRRHIFPMEVRGVQPLVTSGTVKRVGLYHLWTRL